MDPSVMEGAQKAKRYIKSLLNALPKSWVMMQTEPGRMRRAPVLGHLLSLLFLSTLKAGASKDSGHHPHLQISEKAAEHRYSGAHPSTEACVMQMRLFPDVIVKMVWPHMRVNMRRGAQKISPNCCMPKMLLSLVED